MLKSISGSSRITLKRRNVYFCLISTEPTGSYSISKQDAAIVEHHSDLVSLLKDCARNKDLSTGISVHSDICNKGLLQKSTYVGNNLINMFVKCGALDKAQLVFDELPVRNVVSWTALISGYAKHGRGMKALYCFEQMCEEGLAPNEMTFSCLLKSCGSIGAIAKGKQIHAKFADEQLLNENDVLGTALVDMYAKCGALIEAQEAFSELLVHDVVSWTALSAGYVQHTCGNEALNCFHKMLSEGFIPNAMTYTCMLKACTSLGASDKGKIMHTKIVNRGLMENGTIGNALVDMYAKCGKLAKAQQVFHELSIRDVISWTALIAGYCKYGYNELALEYFERMQISGFSPDAMTFSCILKACGSMGAITKGEKIHTEISKEGLLKGNDVLGSALVDMYSKCGSVIKAQEVFNNLGIRDLVSWTALISGYVQVGQHDIVCDLFKKMIREGIKPDSITFSIVLNACSCLGLADEGQYFFVLMKTKYGICPTLEHYTCMVGLFARTGHFGRAVSLIKIMSGWDYIPLWFVLLDACKKWGNLKIGRMAFDHVIRLDAKFAIAYTYMANMYSAAGLQEEAEMIKAMTVKISNDI